MSTLKEDLTAIKEIQDGLVGNKVARFSYTQNAYDANTVNGVNEYNVNNEQNIPNGTASIMKVNSTVLDKGYRAQASSITRMLMNHFLGRISYNLNKVNDNMQSLLNTLITKFPTSLPANGGTADKVANSLTFGEKAFDGSSNQIITANDLGLLIPDLTNILTVNIVETTGSSPTSKPFTVPSDGWILFFEDLDYAADNYALIDNVGFLHLTPSQNKQNVMGTPDYVTYNSLNCPYPVKKGQVITAKRIKSPVKIKFAPCKNV